MASIHRLTIALSHVEPPTRRRVEVPSDLTLAGLHQAIGVLFDWGGDHLYQFEAGRRAYGDPFYLADLCEDDDVPLAEVAGRPGKVLSYTYDLGASWRHRIVVDAVEPAAPGIHYPRCVGHAGPHPAEYDDDQPRAVDVDALDKRLAALAGWRKAPASASASVPATAEVSALAADARQVSLLQDLVRLARWTATPRAVTPTGALKKPEVPGALEVLGLPAAPAGFHSARNLPRLDVVWRLAEDLGLVDVSGKDAVVGPGLAALADDAQTVSLWTGLWEAAAVDGKVLIHDGRALGRPWLTPPLLWELWEAGGPMAAGDFTQAPRFGHDPTGMLASLLGQLARAGGIERLPDGRYQLTPLGRHAHRVILEPDLGE